MSHEYFGKTEHLHGTVVKGSTQSRAVTSTKVHQRKLPANRVVRSKETVLELNCQISKDSCHCDASGADDSVKEVGVQTVENSQILSSLQTKIGTLEAEIINLNMKLSASMFRLSEISTNPEKLQFYTGFQNYATLKIFFDSLGPAVNHLNYWGSEIAGDAD